jgi:hypothetical protein
MRPARTGVRKTALVDLQSGEAWRCLVVGEREEMILT